MKPQSLSEQAGHTAMPLVYFVHQLVGAQSALYSCLVGTCVNSSYKHYYHI